MNLEAEESFTGIVFRILIDKIDTLFAMGVIFATIAVLLSAAYKIAPPPTVGTFEYSYLIFAVIWDVTVFGLVPSATTLLGILLIVGAGLLVIRSK